MLSAEQHGTKFGLHLIVMRDKEEGRKEGERLVGILMGTRHLAIPAVSKGADIILQDRGGLHWHSGPATDSTF